MPAFVILHHVLDDSEHWDLMLEDGNILRTWQLTADPHRSDLLPIKARLIGDHRKAYLDYEGPISGNRGHVTRVDRGAVTDIRRNDDLWLVTLDGERLTGAFRLSRQNEDWRLERCD